MTTLHRLRAQGPAGGGGRTGGLVANGYCSGEFPYTVMVLDTLMVPAGTKPGRCERVHCLSLPITPPDEQEQEQEAGAGGRSGRQEQVGRGPRAMSCLSAPRGVGGVSLKDVMIWGAGWHR